MRGKRLVLFFLGVFAFTLNLRGQVWLDIGGKGLYGVTALVNQNLLDDGPHNFKIPTGFSFGPCVGLNFGDHHGLQLEYILAKNEQAYEFTNSQSGKDNVIEWESNDLLALYRYYSEGSFIELGPKFSRVASLKQSLPDSGPVEGSILDRVYEDKYISGVLGFGGYLFGNEVFSLILGARIEYSLTDLVADPGSNYPTPYRLFETYKKTRPAGALVYMELDFGIGGVAKANCGKRKFIFGSRYK